MSDFAGLNMSESELMRRGYLQDAYALASDKERRRCEEDFCFFARQFWHTVEPNTEYKHGRHIEAIVDHLNACLPTWMPGNGMEPGKYIPGQIRKLVITMPFRHMKSTLVSVLWPAYVWTIRPEFRWLFSSYSLSLAIRDTMRMRVVITSPHYQQLWGNRFRLLSDQNRKDRFFNSSMGYRMVASRDSGATGEGGDAVICFPYEERVQTELGPMAIGEIVERRLPLRVWSLRPDGALELAPITGWRRNPGSALVRVDLPGGSFRSTPDHPIFTRSGWAHSGDLEPSDQIPCFDLEDGPRELSPVAPLRASFDSCCDTTYCLTVASHGNFVLSAGGHDIVVSNCDDPHNVREADSKVIREATKTWWRESMGSRKNNPDLSFEIVVGQRVHQDDLAAFCRDELGYEVLNLPARYDPDQVKTSSIGWRDWRTVEGERLWPERFSEEAQSSIERSIGPFAVACQLQQNPTPRGGAFIKREWFKRIDAKAALSLRGTIAWVRAWDLALQKEGDSVASLEVGQDAGGTTYLRRGQFWKEDWVVSEARIKAVGEWERNQVVVEAIGTTYTAGHSVAKSLLGHCLVTVQESKRNKVSEAIPWIAEAQAGKIVFIEESEEDFPFFKNNSGPWIEHFLDIFAAWIPDPTLEQRDDEVDAVSLGFAATRGKIPLLEDQPVDDYSDGESISGIGGRY